MTEAAAKTPVRTPRRRRLLKVALIVLALLVLAGVGANFWINYAYVLRPPVLDSVPPIVTMQLSDDGAVKRIGESWLAEKDGILRMRLKGGPFELGYANARLTQSYVREQETEFIEVIRRFVPSDWKLWLLKKVVLVRNRGLDQYIRHEHLVEILGLSQGYVDPFPEIGPIYHRLVNYHAAHDIGHAIINSLLVGCTSLAAKNAYTVDGNLWVGRNFDFNAARCFDENKIVVLFEPDDGLSFISVAWPGLIGVVTGINEKRVFISVNAAHSTDRRRIGTPVSLVLREVMQNAATLDEAVEILRKAEVFVTDSYLVADGKDGRVAVVEKTPARCAMVMMDGDRIVNANHFLSGELSGDSGNLAYIKEGTSLQRHERVSGLVQEYKGRLDAEVIARILRDRSVSGAQAPGLGNEAAINGLLATHSVIADVTSGTIWVSAAPHQLGCYVPFSLEGFDEPAGAEPVPADEILSDGRYQAYLESCETLKAAFKCLADGDPDKAAQLAAKAAEANPGYYEPLELLGDVALASGDKAKAVEQYERALAAWPPFNSERERIARKLDAAHAKSLQ